MNIKACIVYFVICDKLYLMTSSDEICYPCNICKQTFLEFFDKDVMFNIMTHDGKMEVMSFEKLMSTTFTKEDLV